MTGSWQKRALRWIIACGAGYVLFLLVIVSMQRHLIYFPSKAPEEELRALANRSGMEPLIVDDTIAGWQTPLTRAMKYRLLVFHGNAGFALHRGYFLQLPPRPEEWQVIVAEYPGYGARAGVPGEAAFHSAAESLLIAVRETNELPLFIAGESIGSGVATRLAASHPREVAGLLLVTPMSSLPDVAAHHYPWLPVRWLLRDRYDSVAALKDYDGPVAFVVADRDEIMPRESGRTLYESYQGPKEYFSQPKATHNMLDFSSPAWEEPFQFLVRESGARQ